MDQRSILVRPYRMEDVPALTVIWNQVIEDGVAFPQLELLDENTAPAFFAQQTCTAAAIDAETGNVLGLYTLHPNNVGRCGHIGNASYAVHRDGRGLGVGEALVRHCLKTALEAGFTLMQFNAVVNSNHAALHLYEKLGFVRLGTIPGGFYRKDGSFEDIVLFYRTLSSTNLPE